MQEAHQTLDDLQASIGNVSDKMKSAAVYFCQDASKFKLEELLTELFTFVKDFTSARKVRNSSTLPFWSIIMFIRRCSTGSNIHQMWYRTVAFPGFRGGGCW